MITRREWLQASTATAAGLITGAHTHYARAATGAIKSPRARLSLNENPFGPAPSALQAIRDNAAEASRYTEETAAIALARQLAERERMPVEQILLGEILEALGTHLSLDGGPGGEIIYSNPGYTALADAAAQLGGIAVPVPLDAQLQNDLPRIAAAISARTRAVFLVNPHNPSGTVSDVQTFNRYVTEMSRRALVIVDEAYLDFMEDFEARSAVNLTRAGHDVMVFRTFGKLYGLAGLQMGYVIAPAARAQHLKQRGLGHFRSLNSLGVAAASASLRDPHYVTAVRNKVIAERRAWTQLFDELRLRSAQSHGNFVFFETRRPHKEVASALLREGIEIGRAFDLYDHWARISIGLPEENSLARTAIRKLLSA